MSDLGPCHYRKALHAAQRATEYTDDLGFHTWALPELVEAAASSDAGEIAAIAYHRIAEIADDSGTDWALGVKARSHALLAAGDEADSLYRESISRLSRVRARSELARAHLLYGEWLRRERRRGEARTQLREAHTMLEEMGMAAFAERARWNELARRIWRLPQPAAPATGSSTQQPPLPLPRTATPCRTDTRTGATCGVSELVPCGGGGEVPFAAGSACQ